MHVYNGSCSCGEIRYYLKKEPIYIHVCHCTLCRKLTGSAFVINILIEGSNFKVEKGELKDFIGTSGSGKKHLIRRCLICGDPIVSFYGDTKSLAVIKGGTINDSKYLKPNAHVFLESKLDWVILDKKILKFKKFYDFKKVLTEGNYKRILKLKSLKNNKN